MASVWVWQKILMLSVLELSLPLNQQYIKMNFKKEFTRTELGWSNRGAKVRWYKFEDDVNKCIKVLHVILFWAGYCCYAVFKKIKSNSCKTSISGRDNVEERPEIVVFRRLIEILFNIIIWCNYKFCSI